MDLGLAGKNAIVTGGSLGIGKAIALELAREGVNVAIAARTKGPLEAAAHEISVATGRRIIPVVADVTSRAQVDGMVAQAAAQLGGVHILVNSGSPPGGSATATGPIETVVDEDLLHGAAPIHELIERDVLGLEAQIATRAFVAARILDHGISTAAAPTQVRAFDVRTWRRHERRIVQTTTEDLPDVDHCPSPAVRLRLRPHEELVERRQASGRRISTGSRPDRTRGMARDYRISLSTERSQAARS